MMNDLESDVANPPSPYRTAEQQELGEYGDDDENKMLGFEDGSTLDYDDDDEETADILAAPTTPGRAVESILHTPEPKEVHPVASIEEAPAEEEEE